jgi:hypothetical protein
MENFEKKEKFRKRINIKTRLLKLTKEEHEHIRIYMDQSGLTFHDIFNEAMRAYFHKHKYNYKGDPFLKDQDKRQMKMFD